MNNHEGISVAVLLACSAAPARHQDNSPLRAGATWVYKRTVNGIGVTTTVRVLSSTGVAARVEGSLGDLAFDPDAKPRLHVLAWRGAVLYDDDDPWLEFP